MLHKVDVKTTTGALGDLRKLVASIITIFLSYINHFFLFVEITKKNCNGTFIKVLSFPKVVHFLSLLLLQCSLSPNKFAMFHEFCATCSLRSNFINVNCNRYRL